MEDGWRAAFHMTEEGSPQLLFRGFHAAVPSAGILSGWSDARSFADVSLGMLAVSLPITLLCAGGPPLAGTCIGPSATLVDIVFTLVLFN